MDTDVSCSPSFFATKVHQQHDESDSDNKSWYKPRWSSAFNWSRCASRMKQSTYSINGGCEDGEYEDCSEQQHCIKSKHFKLNGDSNNNISNEDFVRRKRLWLLVVVGLILTLLLTATLVTVFIIVNPSTTFQNTAPASESTDEVIDSSTSASEYDYVPSSSEYETFPIAKSSTESITKSSEVELEEARLKKIELGRISRLSWDLINKKTRHHRIPSKIKNSVSDKIVQINRDEDDDDTELVLPPNMVYTSSDYHLRRSPDAVGDIQSDSSRNPAIVKKNCCKTQRYSQVITAEGCEPVTVANRMCIGQCVSVWVPGLFASFPVCKPSRSVWRTVRLKCGQDGSEIQKVRVEKVKRCSCMQIEHNDHQYENEEKRAIS